MTLPWLPRPVLPARQPHHLDLSTPRAHADGLRGDLLWDGPTPADIPVDAAARARSAVRLTGTTDLTRADPPAEGVLCLLVAAWVHTGGTPPDVLDVAVPRPVRARFGAVRHRCVPIADRDVVVVGGVRVTSPEATVCDLLRALARGGEPGRGALDPADALLAVRRLLGTGVSSTDVGTRLRASRRAGSRQACDLLSTGLLPTDRGQLRAFSSAREGVTGAASGRTPVTR